MAEDSRPPSPPVSAPQTPSLANLPSFNLGYFSAPFERFKRDEAFADWGSAFTLLDTLETYWDARVDLLERNLKKHSDKIKLRAEEALKRTRPPSGELMPKDLEREIQKFKLRISKRMSSLATAWQSTKVVRTWAKIAFFLGVMTVLASALMFGLAPEWLHVFYTVLACTLLPVRFYTYKKKAWHYFLFDLCYYSNILCLVYIWMFPSSPTLWVASYCLAHGSLASAVITWRNSLVFHDWDKVTSVFIHIYPPFVFTVIRHFYPNAAVRFPAVGRVPHLDPVGAFTLSGLIYMIWQGLYWKFVLIDRRKKIESGQRTTSFSFLLHDKRGLIGRKLAAIKPEYREPSFMAGQLAYALITEIPAVFLLYDSPFWSAVFMFTIFSVSVWNGGGFYIEVFGRKFERELEALRKELAEATQSGASSQHSSSGRTSPTLDTPTLTTEPGALTDNSAEPSPVEEHESLSRVNSALRLDIQATEAASKKDQ
ncbi:hypothetical protein EXIGLDRAFT_758211 [Exidia glandulosa HHB12029]|uniref:Glycerophosphocholine acyltransferase 1 n=1 Tax=Exidia glandulosa HHB12029 TaxID=1314781 RepID=A0A165QPL1_EXIGL|nr:hypothetical protein EXIGLDRAFT_758211 [Exidia glandulosa HHB12029]